MGYLFIKPHMLWLAYWQLPEIWQIWSFPFLIPNGVMQIGSRLPDSPPLRTNEMQLKNLLALETKSAEIARNYESEKFNYSSVAGERIDRSEHILQDAAWTPKRQPHLHNGQHVLQVEWILEELPKQKCARLAGSKPEKPFETHTAWWKREWKWKCIMPHKRCIFEH